MKRPDSNHPLFGGLVVSAVAALLLSVWFVGPPAGASAKLENRPMVSAPQLDANSLLEADTYAKVEAYAKDMARVKPIVVEGINALVESATGDASSQAVIMGAKLNADRPRELFSSMEFTNRCWQLPDISVFREALETLSMAANAGGKDLVIIVAPSKYRVLGYLLGDQLPDLTACAAIEDAVIAQLASEYPDLIKLVDPERVLAYAPHDPYWAGDTHWTPKAGRALSELVVQRIAGVSEAEAKHILATRLKPSGTKYAGGLYQMQGEKKVTAATMMVTKPKFRVKAKKPAAPGAGQSTIKWKATKPMKSSVQSMLILHDSFVNVPSLTRQFNSIVPTGYDVHWKDVADLPLLNPVKTVVVESIDRTFLHRLANVSGIQDIEGQENAMVTLAQYLERAK